MYKVLLPLIFIMSCTGRFGEGPFDYGHPMMNWGYGGMFMGWLLILLLVGLVVFVIYRSQDQKSGIKETPLDILKKRYAKGEITKEDFDRMKKDLSESS